MSAHDARLVPAALLGLVACLAVLEGAPGVLVVTMLGAACALAGAGAYLLAGGGPRPRRLSSVRAIRVRSINPRWHQLAVGACLAAGLAAVLAGGATAQLAVRASPAAQEAIAAGEKASIHGEVTQEARPGAPDRFTGQPTWTATVAAQSIAGAPAKAHVLVIAHAPDMLVMGSWVVLTGALGESHDSRFVAVLWDAQVTSAAPPRGIGAVVGAARDALRKATSGLPTEVRGLTQGMVIGDDSAMPHDQEQDMRRSSLAHLTAVSGAHFAVLTVGVLWVMRRLRLPRLVRAVSLAGVAAAFALLVGAEASVVRAFAMAAAIALALAWGRPARAIAALSAGTIALLAWDPFVAASLGFQLSIAAVAAIVLWAPHLALRLQRFVTPALAHAVSVPVAAAGVTAPLLVGVAGGLGLYGVPANLVAAPFAAPVTVLGLVSLAVSPASPTLATWSADLAGLCAYPVAWAARAFAHAPGAWVAWPPGPLAALALAGIVCLVIAATTSRRVRGWGLIAALLVVAVLAVAVPRLGAGNASRLPDWDVVACDVGQGDMMLLRSGPDSAVVIDAGPPEGDAQGCLERHDVRKIDLLILTHPHRDHDGGVPQLLSTVPVSEAWLTASGRGGAAEQSLAAAGVTLNFPVSGDGGTWGRVHLQVLSPTSASQVGEDGLNDASIVVAATASGAQVLALGDLEHQGQSRLAATLGPVVVDVVKVAHHGSADQDPRLASLITARVAVVSVGADNSYGHPDPAMLKLYSPRAVSVQRTDLCGDIEVAVDNGVRIASGCSLDVAG